MVCGEITAKASGRNQKKTQRVILEIRSFVRNWQFVWNSTLGTTERKI